MAPTKRTNLTWKEKMCDPGQARALETWRTSQRSAAVQLDIIGFGCFAQYGRH